MRHGRTAHNASRRLLGRLDPPLDDLGARQAAALGASELLEGVTRVVASPLARATQTAAAIGTEVETDERWIEIDYGVYDGMALADVPPGLFSSWRDDPEWTPEAGESMGALGRRVVAACEDLWEEASVADVAVVTHVSPIKAAIAWALDGGDATRLRLFVDTASVHRIGPGRSGPTLLSFNEIHHRPSA